MVPLDDYLEGKRDFFSGIFFQEQTEESLIKAVQELDARAHLLIPEKIRAQALTFDRQVFKEKIIKSVLEKIHLHNGQSKIKKVD